MNAAAQNDLTSMLADRFSSIIRKYGLKVVKVDDSEALLVGAKYALRFSADMEGLGDLIYIERVRDGRLAAYSLRALEMKRFTQEDRANYGHPNTMLERWSASLSVVASGLANRCDDLLSGEKSWLNKSGLETVRPSPMLERILDGDLQ